MARLDPELEYLLERTSYFKKHPEEARLRPGDVPDPQQVLNISVHFNGTVDELRRHGFNPVSTIGLVSSGTITLADLQALANDPGVISIDRLRRKTLQLKDSIPDIRANQVWSRSGDTFSNFTGKNTIVGIVDTGINFPHESFRKPDGTSRILRIWDQTLIPAGAETSPAAITDPDITDPQNLVNPKPTIALGYGVEYTQQHITGTLQNAGLPVTARHKDVDGHGTHVAGIAAGNGRQAGACHGSYTYIGVAPEADIIMVRLWGLTTGDSATAPAGSGDTMLEAISYILNHAKHTFNKPVAINLSLGSFSEQMDGSSNECTTMNALLNNTNNDEGFAIVFAAGNEANSAFHAKGTVPAGPTAVFGLRFRVLPSDTDSRSIRILYTGTNLQVRVTSPVGGPAGIVGWVTNGNSTTSNTANGAGAGSPNVFVSNGATPNTITIRLNPGNGSNVPGTATNDWLIELQDTGSTATAVDAFCLYGSGHDRKSPFFLDSVTVQTTLSEECTATEVISVGSYSVVTGRLARSSGRGLTRDLRLKPEITAPGVGIESAGIDKDLSCKNCCCDCCHDHYVVKSGTSMAAPHITGAVALLLEKKPDLTHVNILSELLSHARVKPAGSTVDEDMGWGGGKLDIKATIDPLVGGGGVTGPHTPFYKPVYNDAEIERAETLYDHLRKSKRGPEFIELFKRYFYEIRDLINYNKRVATVWHRSKGPMWIRAGIRSASSPQLALPLELEGFSLMEGISRMTAILKRYGSKLLAHDLEKYEAELKMIREGMNVYDLMEVFEGSGTVRTE